MFKIQIWHFIQYNWVDSPRFGTFETEGDAWKRVRREVRETEKDMGRFKVVPA